MFHKVPELTLAQQLELTPAEIGHNVHAYPTLSEVLPEVAETKNSLSVLKYFLLAW